MSRTVAASLPAAEEFLERIVVPRRQGTVAGIKKKAGMTQMTAKAVRKEENFDHDGLLR